MAAIPLHTSMDSQPSMVGINPLPELLQTPSGLALLELQGTINLPTYGEGEPAAQYGSIASEETHIGRLIFPDFDLQNPRSTAWMKRVYMYVGKHQRLTGEVKKLPKAIAVIRKRKDGMVAHGNGDGVVQGEEEMPDELEIVEIVKYKILFSTRPEPVGTWAAGDL